MSLKLEFAVENDKLIVKGLPPHLTVRGMGYTSAKLAELKRVSVASANIMLAKFYMDSVKTRNSQTDPHMLDAALLAAIVKYGSVFKADSNGKSIDPSKIFLPKVLIINKSVSERPLLIDDPSLDFRKSHDRLISIRDQFVAHDDHIIGHTGCFAAMDNDFNCEHVIAVTQRSPVYSAIKNELATLPMCIDIVFTRLKLEKDRLCQVVTDEINRLKLRVRKRFPGPKFDIFRGLPDAAERKLKTEPYWSFDWDTGGKQQVGQTNVSTAASGPPRSRQ
jgi:hypothetical protein